MLFFQKLDPKLLKSVHKKSQKHDFAYVECSVSQLKAERMEIQKLRLARIPDPPYSPYFAMQLLTLRFRERGIERQ
jgi:hypothetical protein